MRDADPRSDGDLVEAANKGDVAAFESLYYRYRDWVVRLARRFTGNDHDALDVLQDTFSYLLRKLPRLRLSSRMTTFLYPAVKHRALNLRQRRSPGHADESVLNAIPTAVELLMISGLIAYYCG